MANTLGNRLSNLFAHREGAQIVGDVSHVAVIVLPLGVRWDTAPTTHERQQIGQYTSKTGLIADDDICNR